MKAIYKSMFRTIILIFLFSSALIGQKEDKTVGKDSIRYRLTNLTDAAQAIQASGGNLHLADYTGFESDNQYENDLVNVANEISNSLEFSVYDLGLWTIMSYTENGINQSIAKIKEEKISSDKYVLFHYNVLADKNIGEIKFVVEDKVNGISEDLSSIANIINTQLNYYLSNDFVFLKRALIEAKTLQFFLDFYGAEDLVSAAEDAGDPLISIYPNTGDRVNYISLSGKVFEANDISNIVFWEAVASKHNPSGNVSLDVRGMVYSFIYEEKLYTARCYVNDKTKFKGYATGKGADKKFYNPKSFLYGSDLKTWLGIPIDSGCPKNLDPCNYTGYLVKLECDKVPEEGMFPFEGEFYSFSELENSIDYYAFTPYIIKPGSDYVNIEWKEFNSFDDVGVFPNYKTKRPCINLPKDKRVFELEEYMLGIPDTLKKKANRFTLGVYNDKFLLAGTYKNNILYGYELDKYTWEPTGDMYYYNGYCGKWLPLTFDSDSIDLFTAIVHDLGELYSNVDFSDPQTYVRLGEFVVIGVGTVSGFSEVIIIVGVGLQIVDGVLSWEKGNKKEAYLTWALIPFDLAGLKYVQKGGKWFIEIGGKVLNVFVKVKNGVKKSLVINFYKNIVQKLPTNLQKEFLEDAIKNWNNLDEVLNSKFIQFFANYEDEAIYTWKFLKNRRQMRKDFEILESVLNMRKKIASFSETHEELLDKIFENLAKARAGCKTCPSSVNKDLQVGDMFKVVDDLTAVIKQYSKKNNVNLIGFLDEMAQSAKKSKAGAFTLDLLNNRYAELAEDGFDFARFEGRIPDIESGHLLDMLFEKTVNGIKYSRSIEVKNWAQARSITGKAYEQFRAYISSGHEFRYYFNGISEAMKGKFQNVFKDNDLAEELFEIAQVNGSDFFSSRGINTLQELKNKANDLSSDLYNFIY